MKDFKKSNIYSFKKDGIVWLMKNTAFLLLILSLTGCSSNFSKQSSETVASKNAVVANQGATISGTIRIADNLMGKIKKENTLFIIAKKGEAGPPLAVKKIAVSSFPVSFQLSQQDVMMPGLAFEGKVSVAARIDQDGLAGPPEPGDLEGKTAQLISVGSQAVELTINKSY